MVRACEASWTPDEMLPVTLMGLDLIKEKGVCVADQYIIIYQGHYTDSSCSYHQLKCCYIEIVVSVGINLSKNVGIAK